MQKSTRNYQGNENQLDLLNDILPPFVKFTALQKYYSAEEGIQVAFENNYSHWYVDLSLTSEADLFSNEKRIDCLNKIIHEKQVFPIVHGNFKSTLSSDLQELRRAAIEYTKKEIIIASKLSAPLIIHGGAIVEPRLVKKAKQDALTYFLESTKELQEFAKKHGVELWLENLSNYTKNHPFYYVFTTEDEFDYILSQLPEVKFFVDIGHLNIGNTNIYEIINRFIHRIVGFSISNNNGTQDQHISLERGTIDYTRIFQELSKLNWSGYIGVEIRDNTPKEALEEIKQLYQKMRCPNAA